MKKKVFVVVVVVLLGVLMSACTDSTTTNPFLSDSHQQQEDVASTVAASLAERVARERASQEVGSPTGDYILLVYEGSHKNTFSLEFWKDNQRVCGWSYSISHPYSFADKSKPLYIVEANCPGMGQSVIEWDLSERVAKNNNGENIPIWTQAGEEFKPLN